MPEDAVNKAAACWVMGVSTTQQGLLHSHHLKLDDSRSVITLKPGTICAPQELRRGLGDGGRAASAGPGAASTHGGLDGSGSGGSGARPGSGRGGEGDGRRAGSAREGEQGASAGGAERPGSARAAGDDGVGADADEAAVAAGSGGDGSGSSGGGSGGASGRTSFKSPLGGDAAPGTAEDLAGIRQALGELQQQLQAKVGRGPFHWPHQGGKPEEHWARIREAGCQQGTCIPVML